MKCVLGKKIKMLQLFDEDGIVIPVTQVLVNPCVVTQIKTKEKDGYIAIQIGSGQKKHINKPEQGHLNRVSKDIKDIERLVEFRLDKLPDIEEGDVLGVSNFVKGDIIDVVGITKGRGFQGVVKRHGFHGSPASHGHKDQLRMPGSIGATDAAHVFKGTRMGGRMGCDRKTIKNLKVVDIDSENNILFIKGALPGSRGTWVRIWSK